MFKESRLETAFHGDGLLMAGTASFSPGRVRSVTQVQHEGWAASLCCPPNGVLYSCPIDKMLHSINAGTILQSMVLSHQLDELASLGLI